MIKPAEPGEWIFHPGEFIADELESRKQPSNILKCKGWGEKEISLLLQGKRNVDYELVSHIRELWGTENEYWFRLQVQWDAYPQKREPPPWPRQFVQE